MYPWVGAFAAGLYAPAIHAIVFQPDCQVGPKSGTDLSSFLDSIPAYRLRISARLKDLV